MIAAVLTAGLFALSAIFGAQAATAWGAQFANCARLSIALVVLAAIAFLFGSGLEGPGLSAFLLSGLIGFGIGDAALFSAYRRIGSRRTILLVQCLAVPFAGVAEWLWLGTAITMIQCFWIVLILAGVSMVLLENKRPLTPIPPRQLRSGIAFGVLGAIGQAGGALLTRHAVELNAAADIVIDGATAGFQRALGGIVVILAILLWNRRGILAGIPAVIQPSHVWPILGNAIVGPVIGVSLYQFALTTTPSGIVLAIVATTPVMILPMAWWWENDRAGPRAIAGSLLAVAGLIALLA